MQNRRAYRTNKKSCGGLMVSVHISGSIGRVLVLENSEKTQYFSPPRIINGYNNDSFFFFFSTSCYGLVDSQLLWHCYNEIHHQYQERRNVKRRTKSLSEIFFTCLRGRKMTLIIDEIYESRHSWSFSLLAAAQQTVSIISNPPYIEAKSSIKPFLK